MSTFSNDIGREEEDGGGWGGLVLNKEDKLLAAKDAEIAALRKALRETLKIWEAFILCPICAGSDGNHGMACNLPKWKVLAERVLAEGASGSAQGKK